MQATVGGLALGVAPDDQMAVGGNDGLSLCVALGYQVFLGLLRIVAQIHALHVDGGVGGVVEFQPVALLVIVVDEGVVFAAHLVDAHGGDALGLALLVCQRLKVGRPAHGACRRQAHLRLRSHDGTLAVGPVLETVAGGRHGLERNGCKEIAVEIAQRHLLAVDVESGGVGIAVEHHRLAGGVAQVEGRVVFQQRGSGVVAVVEVALY